MSAIDITIGGDDEQDDAERARLLAEQAANRVGSAGGGLAARMRAGKQALEDDSTREFPVPTWNGDLVIRARKLNDQDAQKADTALKVIGHATVCVLLREDASQPHSELTWPEIGELMGAPEGTMQSVIIAGVFGESAAAINVFSLELQSWMAGKTNLIAQALGE